MPKTSPEKLAAALRANLKKRKATPQDTGKAALENAQNSPQAPAARPGGPASAKSPPKSQP
jgi:hypothetical protein